MSNKYLPKSLYLGSLGLAIETIVGEEHIAQAQSQSQQDRDFRSALPSADEINKKIERSYPQDLLGDDKTANPAQSPSPSPSVAPTTAPNGNTAITAANYTFVLSTPALITVGIVVGGLALFPIFHLLLNSKKAVEISKSSIWSKLADRFQKPPVLESDAFLHQRSFEKLSQLTNQAENIHADKFGNTEFMTFFKIKSYIARSIGEYTNLDEIIELLKISIDTQNSFATIDSTESRHCSSNQQELYKFVNLLYEQNLDHATFKERVELKLQEILPKLKTDEGREVLQTYAKEVAKVAPHPLAVKLLKSFKKYNLADYSILRSVSNTISLLDGEDLLNLDGLMLLVMVKYEVFEKLGPIVGVTEEHNRPETYSKMLQYIGLKSRHEGSFDKFQEFLVTLKQWEIHYRTLLNVREKYNVKDYRLPKDFTAEVPGATLYQKYKDSFHLIASAAPATPVQAIEVVTTPVPEPVGAAPIQVVNPLPELIVADTAESSQAVALVPDLIVAADTAAPSQAVTSVPELIVTADTTESMPVESAEPNQPTLTGVR